MISVPFTQYLRPNGRRADVSIEVSDNIGQLANRIIANGYRFECEELSTGFVSLTIADPINGDDVAIKLCSNGPGVREGVEALISGFKVPA